MIIEEGGRGGVADYTIELASALTGLGQPVELVTASDHLYPPMSGVRVRPWFRYVRPTSAFRRALRRVGLGRVLNALSLLVAYPRCAWLARRCRLVHLQGGIWFPLAVLETLLFRATGSEVVHTPHNTFDRQQPAGRALRMMERVSSRTIVHTKADLGNLSRPERAVVIPHGEYVGLARRAERAERGTARDELGLPQDAPVTLVFGQLRPDKGLDEVLVAAREVPELHVLVAGEDIGGLAMIAPLLEDAGLAERVVIREGFLTMDEAATVFAAADTVTFAYRKASHSGVLMLAYGFERPVIVYPVGGLPDAVVAGETGWICSSASRDGLTAAFREVVDAGPDECLRRGRAGFELAASEYSWPEIARRTLALYNEVAPC
jgi:glycosyltransferase involved in cell wall biosynthesis